MLEEYKFVAPNVDALLRYFDRDFINQSAPSNALSEAMDPLFQTLNDLAPVKKNDEVKAIWINVPRGTIEDFGSYEDMLEWGEVENREEYERYWMEEYPEPVKWYELVIAEGFGKDGSRQFRFVQVGNRTIINACFDREGDEKAWSIFREEPAINLCKLLVKPAEASMQKLREGTYNGLIRARLPYQFRTGVIPRSVLWERKPEWKEYDLDGLSEDIIGSFRDLLNEGINDKEKIGRMKSMTANDFFNACAIGYAACGYEGTDLPPVKQYCRHADGRDEGLTGLGYGMNDVPGIDFDDPDAWDEWFFRRNRGGHPWEVCRGGNSTHVDLYVQHDRGYLDYLFRSRQISESEYHKKINAAGYYFVVAGKYRATEAVKFYTALSAAGLPVILDDADEIRARYDGSGYIGIVPRSCPTRYCEGLFPEKYGRIIDFIHVYEEEMAHFGDAVEWLPEEEAKLIIPA